MVEHTLPEIARVKISLQNPVLSKKRKSELRYEALKVLVESKGYGTRIKMKEIADTCNFKTTANAHAFINRLMKHGKLIRHEISQKRFFYTIPGQVNTHKLPETEPLEPTPADVASEEDDRYKGQPGPEPAISNEAANALDNYAMKYVYYYPDGDVRGFVKWLKSQGVE